MRRASTAALTLLVLLAAAASAEEEASRGLPAWLLVDGETPQSLEYPTPPASCCDVRSPTYEPFGPRRNCNCELYRPTVPIGEMRSTWTTLVLPPQALSLASAEAQTPRRGQFRLSATRLSDDRLLQDDVGRFWETDGEIQIVTAEVVTPGKVFPLFGSSGAIHGVASLHMYSLEVGLFDAARNFVEEYILGGDDAVLDEHDIGGRTLTVDDEDLLGHQDTMFKARIGTKIRLPSAQLGCGCFHHSLSLGVTPPAFGDKTDSGNRDWAPDATLAYAWDISRKFRLSGATTVAYPGTSKRFDELGVKTSDWILSSMLNLEWWPSRQWGFSFGVTGNTAYTQDTGLPMDLASWYMNIGIQFVPSCKHSLYFVFTENLDRNVQTYNTSPGNTDYGSAQKEADFSFILGWRYSF